MSQNNERLRSKKSQAAAGSINKSRDNIKKPWRELPQTELDINEIKGNADKLEPFLNYVKHLVFEAKLNDIPPVIIRMFALELYHFYELQDDLINNGFQQTSMHGEEKKRPSVMLIDASFKRLRYFYDSFGLTPLASVKLDQPTDSNDEETQKLKEILGVL